MNPKIQQAIPGCATVLMLVCAALMTPPALAADMTIAQAGAHASHTQDNRARAALSCAECHAPVCAPTGTKNVVFGSLAGATATYDPTSRTCSNVYCHGSAAHSPTWTYVYTPQAPTLAVECAMCHGYPPSSHDASTTSCNGCHTSTFTSDGTIDLAGGKHVNGTLEVSGGSGGSGCASCHGFPPATGAHVAHFGLPGVTAGSYSDAGSLQDRYPGETPTSAPAVYAFGCATCHSLNSANHRNGRVEVALFEAATPPESLKARNASTAAFDGTAKTCSGVYCHSSGQAAPAYVTTPAWSSGLKLGCGGCHANPPRYTSGGAGTATANNHLGVDSFDWVVGHFRGIGAVGHADQHGTPGNSEAAITCQTCHFDTTDPSNTGVSGFYYLDTSGDYEIAGTDPAQGAAGCIGCHSPTGTTAPGAGKVLPLRHVNGTRDVAFDRRTAIDQFIPYLPAAPNTPAKPYWRAQEPTSDWAGAVWNGTTVSFDLAGSTYNPTSKTCTVACHAQLQWGAPHTWSWSNCGNCHPSYAY
jgi:predicted CxxxxCH...CXXCH cytochrome family protein